MNGHPQHPEHGMDSAEQHRVRLDKQISLHEKGHKGVGEGMHNVSFDEMAQDPRVLKKNAVTGQDEVDHAKMVEHGHYETSKMDQAANAPIKEQAQTAFDTFKSAIGLKSSER
ncbi:hypothetical protein HK101_001297 [Irineochytrium annulatum]|nr:hypothetical protein HK101_001297 [Irineochytrium annulatum]